MTPRTAAQAFADVTSALTREYDVTDVLARLIADCAQLLSAKAIGVLVLNAHSDLELLASTSHRVAELELFQIQHNSGPCVDATHTSEIVTASGAAEMTRRWPAVGPAIAQAGYQALHAYPLRWHGHTLGAMNVFHGAGSGVMDSAPIVESEEVLLGQAFADIATIVIVQATELTLQQVTDRVQQALHARTSIEQAKGVLAYQHNLDMAEAYELLRSMAAAESSLTATADAVIAEARQRADG
jgi:hypothetical protein